MAMTGNFNGPGPYVVDIALVSGYGNVPAVASGTSAASANTTAIQTALTLGGLVTIPPNLGDIYINDTLVIGSNTTFVVGDGTTIRLTGGTLKNLLITSAYQKAAAGTFTSVSLAWTAGKTVTVTETAHGRAVGSYVFVYSTTLSPSNFIGVFPVASVVNANSYTIRLHRTPTTGPTGTAQLVTANTSITVTGGKWNQDAATNSGGTSYGQMALVLGACAHLTVRNVIVNSASKYCLELGGVYDYRVDGFGADTSNSDIIKVYGPAVAGSIKNVSGQSGDDTLSLQGKEAAAFIAYAWTWGDIHDCVIENISAAATVNNIVTVYGSPNEYIGGIRMANIGGAAEANGVGILAGYSNSVIDDVVIDGTAASGTYGLRLGNNGGFTGNTINRLEVRGVKLKPDTYASNRNCYLHDSGWAANELTFIGLDVNDGSGLASGTYFAVINGTVGTLNVIGGRFSGASNTSRGFQCAGAVTTINCNGMSVGANCNVLFDLGAGAPTVNLTGNDFNNFGAVVGTTVACNVNFSGNRINVGGNGFVRSNAAVVIKLRSGGNNLAGGSLFTNGSGTGLWEFYGSDMQIDVGATGVQKTISGQYVFNNGSARGTLTQNRLVTCNGTNWVQVDDTTKTF